MLSDKLKEKLNLYEQIFFGQDKPVPFKDDLLIYPVKVKDYYTFYSNLSCLQMDKTVIKSKEVDEFGREKIVSVPNPKGISQSYMSYLISQMENEEYGRLLTQQVVTLLELIFHVKNGFYCPNCHEEELTYEQMLEDVLLIENNRELNEEQKKIAKQEYFIKNSVCSKCGAQKRDIIGVQDDGKEKLSSKRIYVYDSVFNAQEFDELIAIILHYNILNYDGDTYMDPKLKEAMEQKALMENQNYNAPSLEKQLVCISVSSPYTLEMLEELTLRKMTLMLKVIDAKVTYQAQLQGMFSGMVKFKEDPPHWIFSSDKKDFSKQVMQMGEVREKFKYVT